MKKIFLTIEIIILISNLIFSQTEWEYIGLVDPSIGETFDIEIDDNGDIYTTTEYCPLYKSINNGTTWKLKNNDLPSAEALKLVNYNNSIYLAKALGINPGNLSKLEE